jgi:two-component system, NarL family, nitrate/nitrite response regulator NarL
VCIATTGAEGLRLARDLRPALVLMDVGLPDRSGIAIGKQMLEELEPRPNGNGKGDATADGHIRLVAITALDDSRLAQEALRAGFRGYLMKDMNVSQLLSSIEAVLEGQIVVPPKLARLPQGIRVGGDLEARLLAEQLTKRELEVLELLATGAGSRAIALELGVAPNTVRTYVQSILSKLQVHSRLEAAAFAVRHSLVRRRR